MSRDKTLKEAQQMQIWMLTLSKLRKISARLPNFQP